MSTRTIDSPVGRLKLTARDGELVGVAFGAARPAGEPDAAIEMASRQLEEYFGGRRDEFDVPLDLAGISPFTQSVLAATTAVPFGHLATYRDIAEQIGAPRATRAVGNALGRNPIPVIVPCHRIVRSDATIGGYTGGLGIKKRLLALEGIAAPN